MGTYDEIVGKNKGIVKGANGEPSMELQMNMKIPFSKLLDSLRVQLRIGAFTLDEYLGILDKMEVLIDKARSPDVQ
jgi:hypothetical protein